MTFDDVLPLLKAGRRVARSGMERKRDVALLHA